MPAPDKPSKSQRKREVTELQDLGATLTELSADQLAQLDLPEALRDAVMEARKITAFGARRRQLQYIGKLMRHVDPEPLRAKIDAWTASSHAETARLHRAEHWRDRLIDDESALAEFTAQYPRADAQQISLLVLGAERERQQGRPPRSYRALFQLVRDIIDA